jgi:uncharacterized protein (DUF305 family)
MNNQPILYGMSGLVIGLVIAGFTTSYAVNHNSTRMMQTLGIHTLANKEGTGMSDMMDHAASSSDMSMAAMVSELKGRTGDDFDKAFLIDMTIHHQGAINMAALAKTSAKHQEIKDLANGIIAAQTKEIGDMKVWQTQWGY